MRYLEMLAQRLEGEEKEEYEKAVFDMRSMESSEEDVVKAEKFVMKVVDRFGNFF